MAASGHIMKGGTIVDATIIDAPTKNMEKKRDPEMHSAKKGNQWRFGMKCHVGVDTGTGYIHTIEVHSANVETLGDFFSDFPGNMTRKMSLLLLKIETIVADSAYKTPHRAFS